MFGMMTSAPPVLDPVNVCRLKIGRIWVDMKYRILIGDKTPEKIIAELTAARDLTEKEVFVATMRDDAVTRYNKMIDTIGNGGQVEL